VGDVIAVAVSLGERDSLSVGISTEASIGVEKGFSVGRSAAVVGVVFGWNDDEGTSAGTGVGLFAASSQRPVAVRVRQPHTPTKIAAAPIRKMGDFQADLAGDICSSMARL